MTCAGSWVGPGRRSRRCSTRPARRPGRRHRAAGGVSGRGRRAGAAAAVPDRRARRRGRRPDRRLPPHRARTDRRRSRRRAPTAEPALRRGAARSSSTGWPDRAGSCRTAGSTSCSSSGCAAHPDAVAAVHGRPAWTYRELNARANRLAHALLARGLRREGVVAVVTERNLDWMAVGPRDLQGGRRVPARSSRTSRPTASRPCCPAPSARSC